ncbi:MAG: shikimate kinase [Deltaproteobacteria bacterium]|jgi:shikimate kinase|nr:shikimate kinase [Deltaproteobacteria bacterium]
MYRKILAWLLGGDEKIKLDNIALIGMRGSGKTTLGIKLAQILDLPFFDIDRQIEKQTELTVKEIFARGEEELFRRKEKDFLNQKSSQSSLVLATGGGIVEKSSNRKLLKKNFFCIWLETDPGVLIKRLKTEKRPSLTSLPLAEEVEYLCKRRESLYCECSNIKINTSVMKVEELTDVVKYIWSKF